MAIVKQLETLINIVAPLASFRIEEDFYSGETAIHVEAKGFHSVLKVKSEILRDEQKFMGCDDVFRWAKGIKDGLLKRPDTKKEQYENNRSNERNKKLGTESPRFDGEVETILSKLRFRESDIPGPIGYDEFVVTVDTRYD